MGHQFNPHNLLSMSLEVDRINQISHLHPAERQALLMQQQKKRIKREQEKIDSRDKAENKGVNQQGSHPEKTASENKKQSPEKDRGSHLDVKI